MVVVDSPGSDAFNQALAFMRGSREIGVDTETTGLDPYSDRILLIQVGNEHQQYVFDVARCGSSIQLLKPFFESTTLIKILHNVKFDYKMLKGDLDITMENTIDTMITEQLLSNGRGFVSGALKDVAGKYIFTPMDKGVRSTFQNMEYGDTFSKAQLEYAANDVACLLPIHRAQMELIHKHGLDRVHRLETEFTPALADMELEGVYVDHDIWMEAAKIVKVEFKESYDEMNKLYAQVVPVDFFGVPMINYGSAKQLLPVLKRVLGKRGADLKATGVNDLNDFEGDPHIDALLRHRRLAKRLSTYGPEFLTHVNQVTRRIHSSFFQLGGRNSDDEKGGTGTGRLSSTDPKYIRGIKWGHL